MPSREDAVGGDPSQSPPHPNSRPRPGKVDNAGNMRLTTVLGAPPANALGPAEDRLVQVGADSKPSGGTT